MGYKTRLVSCLGYMNSPQNKRFVSSSQLMNIGIILGRENLELKSSERYFKHSGVLRLFGRKYFKSEKYWSLGKKFSSLFIPW